MWGDGRGGEEARQPSQVTGAAAKASRQEDPREGKAQVMQPFELPEFYMPYLARLNPHLGAAREHSKAWAREMGILGSQQEEQSSKIWDERTFDSADYALL